MRQYYVYIMASGYNGTLYIGVTDNLITRVWEHKNDVVEGFTKRYQVHTLVHPSTKETTGLPVEELVSWYGMFAPWGVWSGTTGLPVGLHYEEFSDIREAIQREKQLKKWNRAWKIRLIEKDNPTWKDLYDDVTK